MLRKKPGGAIGLPEKKEGLVTGGGSSRKKEGSSCARRKEPWPRGGLEAEGLCRVGGKQSPG